MFRTEMTIPIRKDPRTFEESRSALFDKLEKRASSSREEQSSSFRQSTVGSSKSEQSSSAFISGASNGGTSHHSSSTSTSSTCTSSTRTVGNERGEKGDTLASGDFDKSDSEWDSGIGDWVRDSRRNWDSDMKRIRANFFNLESSGDAFTGCGDSTAWQTALPSEMAATRLASCSDTSSSSKKSFSSSTVSRSSTTQQQQEQMSSSVISSKTISSSGGVQSASNNSSETTSSSSTSTSQQFFSSSKAVESSCTKSGEDSLFSKHSLFSGNRDDPFAGFPSSRAMMGLGNSDTLTTNTSISNAFDLSKDLYELGEDGKLHFKVRFEAKDYSPDDIQVTTIGNRLMVKAKSVKKTDTSNSVKEFSRSVDLPDRIDHENFSCQLTKDGVLEIDAPVKAPDYESISYSNGELGIKPRMVPSVEGFPGGAISMASAKNMAILNNSGPTVISDELGKKKVHIELSLEPGYLPNDIHVRAEGHKIFVKGRQEKISGGRSSIKEFSKFYEVSESLDPLSLDAIISDNILIVEAPLKFS